VAKITHSHSSKDEVPVSAGSMLVEREQRAAELAAHVTAVAGEVAVIGLHVTEHEVAAAVAIVAVQAAPVLFHSAALHAAFYTYGARRIFVLSIVTN